MSQQKSTKRQQLEAMGPPTEVISIGELLRLSCAKDQKLYDFPESVVDSAFVR